jgi:hypothetical protein
LFYSFVNLVQVYRGVLGNDFGEATQGWIGESICIGTSVEQKVTLQGA